MNLEKLSLTDLSDRKDLYEERIAFEDSTQTMEHSEIIGNIHETPELLK